MINRRDLILGLLVLGFFSILVISALLILASLAMNGVHVKEKSIAVIEIKGPILSPRHTVDKLEQYISNENIPAIVLRLNTPGGGISATQEIFETVKKARASGKKVIASMGAIAASGGYYIAAACDTIMATPGTITGSIGVIATFPDFSELYQKIGVNFNVVKSGKFKDTGSSSRKMTDEEKAQIDSLIMDSYEQFILAVSEGRNLNLDFVRSVSDGRVFTGRQAVKQGLVDILGTYQDAIDLAGVLVGIGENPPVVKEPKSVFREMIIDGITNFFSIIPGLNFPQILYILSN